MQASFLLCRESLGGYVAEGPTGGFLHHHNDVGDAGQHGRLDPVCEFVVHGFRGSIRYHQGGSLAASRQAWNKRT